MNASTAGSSGQIVVAPVTPSERTLIPAAGARLAETRLEDWPQSTIGNR